VKNKMIILLASLICLLGLSLNQAAARIIHDAEYYILKAQNGERWAAEDEELDSKLAELKAKHGLDTGTLLDGEYNIACRTGLHCAPLVHEQIGTAAIGGSVRIGIGPFNTKLHIATAIEAIGEIVSFHKKNN